MNNGKPNAKPSAINWPLASHFSSMLQNPKIAFRDPELKQVIIDRDEHNQPRGFAGAFANVYKGTWSNGHGAKAIRVFTSGAAERRERYQFISEYVGRQRLESLVGFSYTDDGIRSTDGKRYPLMTMEWVSGQTLYKWLGEKCRDKNRTEVKRIGDAWIETIQELIAAKIAHGDLQHGNIMVTDSGKLKLVDYDGMCVPKLVGRRNLEIGVKPYQHPQRGEETLLSLDLDNFSALFILVALKALAVSPDLWDKFVKHPQYDKLLFREEDFEQPASSQLLGVLRRSPDSEVQRLSQVLVDLSHAPIDSVRQLPYFLFSFATVESLLNQRDFDSAIEMLTRGRREVSDAPVALQPRLKDAQARVKCRCDLKSAVQDGDEKAMKRLYVAKLLDGYPEAQPLVEVARQAPQVIPILGQLQAAKAASKWRELVALWDGHQQLLKGRTSAQPFVPDVQLWRQRNQACDIVLKLIANPASDDAELESAWNRLVQLGAHPDAAAVRSRVESTLQRHHAWTAFLKVRELDSEESDVAFVRAWNERLFCGWDKAERERYRLQQAKARLDLIAQIRRHAREPLSWHGEKALGKLACNLPEAYQYELRPRIDLARKRLSATNKLKRALQDPVSEIAVEAAWHRFAPLGAPSLLSSAEVARVDLALKRAPLLHTLQKIPPDYLAKQANIFDAQLLALWQEPLLADCREADPWKERFHLARRRKLLLRDLMAALGRADKFKIAELATDEALRGYPLDRDLDLAVERAVNEVRSTRQLLSALENNDRASFCEMFDAQAIRSYGPQFEPHFDKLRQWIRTEILKSHQLGLAMPTGQQTLVWDEEDTDRLRCKIRWNWPSPRFADACLLIACPHRPAPAADLHHLEKYIQFRVTRRGYEEAGGCRNLTVQDGWLGGWVVVAAVVDAGIEQFVSESLVLGQMEPCNKAGRRRDSRGARHS
jgi:Protein kinase domain